MAEATAISETTYHDARFLVGADSLVIEKALIEANLSGTLADVRAGRPSPPHLYDPALHSAGQAFGAIVRKFEGMGSCPHRDARTRRS